MKKLVWGVLSTAKIGREKVIPAMQAADLCDMRAIASRSLERAQQAAKTLGIPVAAVAQTVQAAVTGLDTTYLHDGQSKVPVPVRIGLPLERLVGLDAVLALPMRASNGTLVPLSELVQV